MFCVTFALSTLKASRVLHADILRALLHCPLWLLSDTPSGGILNRFSRDMTEVDTDVPTAISQTLILLFAGASTVIIIGYATPLFWLVIIPIAIVYFFMQVNTFGSYIYILVTHFIHCVTGTHTFRPIVSSHQFLVSRFAPNSYLGKTFRPLPINKKDVSPPSS